MNVILFKTLNILQIKMRKIVMLYFYSYCTKQYNQHKIHNKTQQLISKDSRHLFKLNHLIIINS